jgi:hypothetical protein
MCRQPLTWPCLRLLLASANRRSQSVAWPHLRSSSPGERDFVALAAHPQHPVAMFFTEVVHVAAGGLKDAPRLARNAADPDVDPKAAL